MRRVLTRTVPTASSAGQSRRKVAVLVLTETVAYVVLVLVLLAVAFLAAMAGVSVLADVGIPVGDVVALVVLGLIGAGGILAGLAHGVERKRGGRR